MKKFLFSLFLNILIYSFVFSMLSGVKLPNDPLYLILTYVSLSLGIMLQKPLLKFLTVKNNILTYWLSASILSFGVFYLLITFVPGVAIAGSVFKETNWGVITISSFKMDMWLTMIFGVLFASLLSGIMEGLKKPVEE
jgi:hypothetical protein